MPLSGARAGALAGCCHQVYSAVYPVIHQKAFKKLSPFSCCLAAPQQPPQRAGQRPLAHPVCLLRGSAARGGETGGAPYRQASRLGAGSKSLQNAERSAFGFLLPEARYRAQRGPRELHPFCLGRGCFGCCAGGTRGAGLGVPGPRPPVPPRSWAGGFSLAGTPGS